MSSGKDSQFLYTVAEGTARQCFFRRTFFLVVSGLQFFLIIDRECRLQTFGAELLSSSEGPYRRVDIPTPRCPYIVFGHKFDSRRYRSHVNRCLQHRELAGPAAIQRHWAVNSTALASTKVKSRTVTIPGPQAGPVGAVSVASGSEHNASSLSLESDLQVGSKQLYNDLGHRRCSLAGCCGTGNSHDQPAE